MLCTGMLYWASLVPQLVNNPPAMQKTAVQFLGWKISWRRQGLPTSVLFSFPHGSDSRESTCSMGDLGLIPGWGRSPGGGHGNLLQYSCLETARGQRSLASYSIWGHKESDTTEWCSIAQHSMLCYSNTKMINCNMKNMHDKHIQFLSVT